MPSNPKLNEFYENLPKAKQALYAELKAHIIRFLAGTPAGLETRTLMLVCGIYAYDSVYHLIQKHAKRLSPGEALKICDVACGYALLVPLIDMICQQENIRYQLVLTDIDLDSAGFNYSAFFTSVYAHKRFDHITFVKTDAADPKGCVDAMRSAKVFPESGFHVICYFQPNISGEANDPFVEIFKDTIQVLAGNEADLLVTFHHRIEVARLVTLPMADKNFRRSCPYPQMRPFVDEAKALPDPSSYLAGEDVTLQFLDSQRLSMAAVKLARQAPYPTVKMLRLGEALTPFTFQFVFDVRLNPAKLYQVRRYQSALELYQERQKDIDRYTPEQRATLLLNIGRCHLRLQQYQSARAAFSDAIKHVSADQQALYTANLQEAEGWLLVEKGEDPKASFTSAVETYIKLGKSTSYYPELAEYLSKPTGSLSAAATLHSGADGAATGGLRAAAPKVL